MTVVEGDGLVGATLTGPPGERTMLWKWILGFVMVALVVALYLIGHSSHEDQKGNAVDVSALEPLEFDGRSLTSRVPDSRSGTDETAGLLSHIDPVAYYQLEDRSQPSVNDPVIDMFTDRKGSLTNAQRLRFDELHIIPWNPLVDQECAEVTDELGGSFTRCIPVYERQYSHPYEALSVEDLRGLPEEDAEGLYFLGVKDVSLSREERMQLIIRSSAMLDKPGELLRIARLAPYEIGDQSLDLWNGKRRLMFEFIAHQMGDERADPSLGENSYRQILEKYKVDDEESVNDAIREAKALLAEMNNIRMGLFGLPVTGAEQ